MFEQILLGDPATDERRYRALTVAFLLHFALLLSLALASLFAADVLPDDPRIPILRPIIITISPPDPEPWTPPEEPKQSAPAPGGQPDRALVPEPSPPVAVSQPPALDEFERVPEVDPLSNVDPDRTRGESDDLDNEGLGQGSDESTDDVGTGGGGKKGPGGKGQSEGQGDEGTGPYTVGGGVEPPVLLYKSTPAYPPMARHARLQGRVVLRAVIGVSGRVEEVFVESATSPLFEAAAVEAVQQWRYRPSTRQGQPVPVYLSVTVEFTLH